VPVLEIGVVLLAAALAGAVSRRLGLPAVLGYLVVGLLVGPFTPGYVADRHQIQVLADVGVVLLLFEVGIELDLRALRRELKPILRTYQGKAKRYKYTRGLARNLLKGHVKVGGTLG